MLDQEPLLPLCHLRVLERPGHAPLHVLHPDLHPALQCRLCKHVRKLSGGHQLLRVLLWGGK